MYGGWKGTDVIVSGAVLSKNNLASDNQKKITAVATVQQMN